MGMLTRFDLALLKQRVGLNTLYETGTGHGLSLKWARQCGIENLTSIEEDGPTFEVAKSRLAHLPNITLLKGDALELIDIIPAKAKAPRLIFLDAHFVGAPDFVRGDARRAYIESAKNPRSFPLLEELRALALKDLRDDWIIADDARLYVNGLFSAGECPDWARQWPQKPQLDECFALFSETHDLQLLRQDHGYFLLVPKQCPLDWHQMVRALPGERSKFIVSTLPVVPGAS